MTSIDGRRAAKTLPKLAPTNDAHEAANADKSQHRRGGLGHNVEREIVDEQRRIRIDRIVAFDHRRFRPREKRTSGRSAHYGELLPGHPWTATRYQTCCLHV